MLIRICVAKSIPHPPRRARGRTTARPPNPRGESHAHSRRAAQARKRTPLPPTLFGRLGTRKRLGRSSGSPIVTPGAFSPARGGRRHSTPAARQWHLARGAAPPFFRPDARPYKTESRDPTRAAAIGTQLRDSPGFSPGSLLIVRPSFARGRRPSAPKAG